MTDRDSLYIAACKLPPSPERTTLLDGLAREDRIMRTGTFGKQAILDHYRHILGCIEYDRAQSLDGLNYVGTYDRPDWDALNREAHAQALAAEHERTQRQYGEPRTEPVVIKRAKRYRNDAGWLQ